MAGRHSGVGGRVRVLSIRAAGSNKGRANRASGRIVGRVEGVPVLSMIEKVRREQLQAERRLGGLVDEARAKGCTWQQIGDTLGMTLQGARQKFGPGRRRVTGGR